MMRPTALIVAGKKDMLTEVTVLATTPLEELITKGTSRTVKTPPLVGPIDTLPSSSLYPLFVILFSCT
jgi:hypothetical protein